MFYSFQFRSFFPLLTVDPGGTFSVSQFWTWFGVWGQRWVGFPVLFRPVVLVLVLILCALFGKQFFARLSNFGGVTCVNVVWWACSYVPFVTGNPSLRWFLAFESADFSLPELSV